VKIEKRRRKSTTDLQLFILVEALATTKTGGFILEK
jgi:hypothetical protein